MSILRIAFTAVLLAALPALLFAGCEPARPAANAASPQTVQEQRAVDALGLKTRYKDVVTGTDIKGNTLLLYVDVENLNSMDEQGENAMRSSTLAQWVRIWRSAHPHKHGKLRLSLRDYYGTETAADTANA